VSTLVMHFSGAQLKGRLLALEAFPA
jgi:hypothetical protein